MKIPNMVNNPPLPHAIYKKMEEEEHHNEIIEELTQNYNQLLKLTELKEKELEEAKAESKKAKKYNICMMVISIISMLAAIASWLLPDIINIPSISVDLPSIQFTGNFNIITTIKEIVSSVWNVITEYIAPLGDFCVVIITLFVFFFTYLSKRLTIMGFGESFSVWDGHSISVTLKNMTLSDMAVKKVKLIFDNETEFVVKQYDTPIIMGPLKTMLFASDKMSQNPFGKGFSLSGHKIRAEITLADNRIVNAKINRRLYKKPKAEKTYGSPFIVRYTDGDSIITEYMRYKVVIYKNEDFVTDIIVLKNGAMNKGISGYNALPTECLESKEKVKSAIESMLEGEAYTVNVFDYSIESIHSRKK